jgi:hypothetical protein
MDMAVELDWRAQEEDGVWEVIAAVDAGTGHRQRWWVWGLVMMTLVALVPSARVLSCTYALQDLTHSAAAS